MSGLRLPNSLLDLVLARTSTPAVKRTSVISAYYARRTAHSAVATQSRPPSEHYAIHQSLQPVPRQAHYPLLFNGPTSRSPDTIEALEQRVMALKQFAGSDLLIRSDQTYAEEELLAVYEDLLALPVDERPDTQVQPPASDETYLLGMKKVQDTLRRLSEDSAPSSSSSEDAVIQSSSPQLLLLERLEQVVSSLETHGAVTIPKMTIETEEGEQNVDIPLGLMLEGEWKALLECLVFQGDGPSAERVLNLMTRVGENPSEDCINVVLSHYATEGDIASVQSFVAKYLSVTPSAKQRDLHVKTYLKAIPQTAFPSDALYLLHDYESRGIAAPQRTYARLITHLLSAQSSVAHAHAWDLFSHMRYVAHPKPDAVMYTMMIRACASSSLTPAGEPERALDLFTEMTVDKRIPPTAGAYTAAILACARSGRKKFVFEAFRLAKEMLDAHRDARGVSAFSPDRKFFCALLEGAKRIGDLGRVRWILAEMVKGSLESGLTEQGVIVSEDLAIQEDVMLHVFHAYAAYRPPFKRSMAMVVDADTNSSRGEESFAQSDPSEGKPERQLADEQLPATSEAMFSQLPPQTHAEVIQEAETLFSRMVEDVKIATELEAGPNSTHGIFQHVKLTPKLLNAYLSVHYAHSPIETWRDLYKTVHNDLGVPKTAWAYVEVLERCARSKRGPERTTAVQLAQEVWSEFCSAEDALRAVNEDAKPADFTPRLIERAHSAMIRMLSLSGQLDSALDLVRSFVRSYPPSALRASGKKSALQSTRTSLVGARPLVRSIGVIEIPDDTVPPSLTFTEVEVLHHKLVAANRVVDIKYLKWVCKAYEGALRARRDAVMKAEPSPGPTNTGPVFHTIPDAT